jgi:hypothetical protein
MNRLLVLASLFLARPLLAAPAPIDFDTARGAREVGMGGTFRELGIGANSADGNPAAMALFQAFQLEFAGGYDWKAKGWYAAGWARDSTNPELSGAYSLHYISNDYGGGNVGQWAHSLSLATRLGDKVAFGIGGRWLIQSTPKINAASLNLGVSILIIPQLTLGFAAYNLIDTHHPELSRSFEVGFGLLLGPVRLATEVRSDLGRGPLHPVWNSGLEFFLGRSFALRGGWEWREPVQQNFLTAGVGFVFDNAGLDIGWRHGLAGAGDLLVGGFRIQVQ